MDKKDYESLEGSVEGIIYRNMENGFTVLELSHEEELITVVGEMADIAEGEELKLMGYYTTHPTFGHQFKACICERTLPSTANAIYKYLASGAVKGIGPKTARKIVDAFGDDTIHILEETPQRLLDIKGFTPKKVEKITEDFKRIFGIRALMLFLSKYEVTPAESVRIWKSWGHLSVDMIKENPFVLCTESIGVEFERADNIREDLSYPEEFTARIKSGIEYVLKHNISNGHTCLPLEKVLSAAQGLVDVDHDRIQDELERMLEEEELHAETFGGRTFLFLPYMYTAETYIAGRVRMILDYMPDNGTVWDAEIDTLETLQGLRYASLQREAISKAMSNGLLVMTGGPGTGKTTTLNAMIELFEQQACKVAITAPTGRAAKRIAELTGKEAKTIHRLLEVDFSADTGPKFKRGEKNPLDCDVVIVDELSMVDVQLFESLLRAMTISCKLVLVGDSDQLPSVGAGNLLKDLIDSGAVPYIELTQIFRQAAKSLIVTNAHAIVHGELPDIVRRDSDFFFMRSFGSERTAQTVVDLVKTRLPQRYQLNSMWDIQVLTPSRISELGTFELNRRLQQELNPKADGKREIKYMSVVFRENDKVMHIRNNYDITWKKDDGEQGTGVFNGDIGVIEAIEHTTQSVRIRYEDRVAQYTFDMLGEIEHAYAVTVHKSQGSEFDAVVLPLLDRPNRLYFRNLLYTAVTRAKKLLVVLGNPNTLAYMVHNHKKTLRYTGLKHFIHREMVKVQHESLS